METLVFQQMYHEFPLQFAIRSVSGITHTSPKTHLNSLLVLLGDTRLLTENSYMPKNLDLLASFIAKKKIKSVAHFARTGRSIEWM